MKAISAVGCDILQMLIRSPFILDKDEMLMSYSHRKIALM
jgi:hypothetical protein